MSSGALDELEAYLTGHMDGTMGLRSWLGPMSDYGCVLPTSGGRPPEPGGGALAAARAAARVQETLELVTREQRAVLAAYYAPGGRGAPLDRVVRDADGRTRRLDGVGAGLRALGDMVAVAQLMERPDRLRELVVVASAKGPMRADAARELRLVASRGRRAVRAAQDAYVAAVAKQGEHARERRRERFRASLYGEPDR